MRGRTLKESPPVSKAAVRKPLRLDEKKDKTQGLEDPDALIDLNELLSGDCWLRVKRSIQVGQG